MTDLNPLLANAALTAARYKSVPRPRCVSRTSDKFIVRASADLLFAMTELGTLRGRSTNSEFISALTESLSGRETATAARNIYAKYLGEDLAAKVLLNVERLDAAMCKGKEEICIRLPEGVRSAVAELVDNKGGKGTFPTMGAWITDALMWWINVQRESDALLRACIARDATLTVASMGSPLPTQSEWYQARSVNSGKTT